MAAASGAGGVVAGGGGSGGGQRVRCYGYGMPAILTEELAVALSPVCTSVVIGGDMVPRFS